MLVSIGKFAGSFVQLTYDGFCQRRFEGAKRQDRRIPGVFDSPGLKRH